MRWGLAPSQKRSLTGAFEKIRAPDISGMSGNLVGYSDLAPTGCFTRENSGNAQLSAGNQVCVTKMTMQASLADSTYEGAVVQPASARLIYAIRT